MLALHQQFCQIFASLFQPRSQRVAFDEFVRDSGVIPTMVVCVLGFILMTLVYVGAGLFGTNGEGWFGGYQRYRVVHLSAVTTLMVAMGLVWRYGRSHWNVIAYLVLILGFSFSPVQTFLSGSADGAWRWLAAYFVFMTALFGFLRLPLLAMVAVSLVSSGLVLNNLNIYYELDSLMVALTVGTHILGIGLWLSNRWRDRLLFDALSYAEPQAQENDQTQTLSGDVSSGVLSGTWVLVVDDDIQVRTAMTKVFEFDGANVIGAATVKEALEKVRGCESAVELLVCDYLIDQDGTGLDLIRQLRGDKNENTPAMIISGNPNEIPDVSSEAITVLSKPTGAHAMRAEANRLVKEFRNKTS